MVSMSLSCASWTSSHIITPCCLHTLHHSISLGQCYHQATSDRNRCSTDLTNDQTSGDVLLFKKKNLNVFQTSHLMVH